MKDAAIMYYVQRMVEFEQNFAVVPKPMRRVVKQRLTELGFKLNADGYIIWENANA